MTERRITFGWHLDGQRSTEPRNTLGESVVGPMGFLTLLETQLGLMALHPAQTERIVQYRICLQDLDADHRFYHQSFSVDPLGTAACLLDWRDQWALHGWDGCMAANAPKRLRDMAEIEAMARTAVSPNIGQRLKAVRAALEVRKLEIDQVLLIDPLASLCARHLPTFLSLDYDDAPSAWARIADRRAIRENAISLIHREPPSRKPFGTFIEILG